MVQWKRGLVLVLLAGWAGGAAAAEPPTDKVDFARDVRTILSNHCLACHGPDEGTLKAGLRLDIRDHALKPLKSGRAAIVPSDIQASELVRRIVAQDPDEVMPPPETKKPLTDEQKRILTQWIAEGAEYELHWSFVPVNRAAPPATAPLTNQPAPVNNEIDLFVLRRLESQGLGPSPRADKYTLVRRLYLDLLGLPPTPQEADEFVADSRPDAWERLVDRVLNSPRFGEKIGLMWLDLARFGDTNGYHYDSTREMWLWRDYVVDAYNRDKPYDQFTLEQLAGDLLDNPTTEQLIASGFNRNTRFNEEGGADPEEFAVTYAKDRVFTLGQVWLGLTTGCAECHSHKYDPISQKEYYQLYAFFNSIQEPMASGNHGQKLEPLLRVPTAQQAAAMKEAQARKSQVDQRIAAALGQVSYEEPGASAAPGGTQAPMDYAWIDDGAPRGTKLEGNGQSPDWHWVQKPRHPVYKGKKSMRRSAGGLSQHFFTGATPPLAIHSGDKLFAYVWLDPKNPPTTIQLQFHSAQQGWSHRAYWGEDRGHGAGLTGQSNHRAGDLPEPGQWARLEVDAAAVGLGDGLSLDGWAFTQFAGTVYYDYSGVHTTHPPNEEHYRSQAAWEKVAAADNAVPPHVRDSIKIEPANRSEAQQKLIRDYYVRHVYAGAREIFDPLNKEAEEAAKAVAALEGVIPTTMISKELDKPREAHLLIRGDFLTKGEKVERDVPAVFPPMDKDLPRNRLGLARWLADEDHPLTARVAVNRLWYQMFGTGLVKTLGDFGVQGELPSHPDLLDWLASEFVREGWSTKAILRQIALSATYQQDSSLKDNIAVQDPYNRLLYRGPRFRVSAEEVRDGALAIAGLLSTKVGGPSVMPYQPADFYVGKMESWPWKVAEGEDLYRRGMYTFWRRTALHPMFAIFDAPSREVCTVERTRTNTPLQALATLNGPAFVEAARVLAQEMLADGPAEESARIEWVFRRVMTRKPTAREAELIAQIYRQQHEIFQADPSGATGLVQTGQYRRPENVDAVEHAAWTAVANALMNTDEAITRE